jgi:hypothetical protein
MTGATVGDMIDKMQEYEHLLNNIYSDLRGRSSRDVVRLLTYRLAREHNHVARFLKNYPAEQIAALRSVRLRHPDTEFLPERCFEDEYLAAQIKPTELLDSAIRIFDILACFSRWLANEPVDPKAQKLLSELAKAEEEEIMNLTKLKAENGFRTGKRS